MNRNRLATVLFSCFLFQAGTLSARADKNPSAVLMPATFTVDDRSLVTRNSFAVLTDEFFGGKTLALKILYTPKEVTEAAKADLLKSNGRSFTNDSEHAYLVLFLDKTKHLWQVNLTVVLKGMTTAYTVASTPSELEEFASKFIFDGTTLQLQSKGKFQNTADEKVTTVTWDVRDNLPVYSMMSSRPQ